MTQFKSPKLLVLADDFSGAAEMAGIAFAYGLRTRVIFNWDSAITEDVLVLNTNTRSLPLAEALNKLSLIIRGKPAVFSSCRMFKKIDSVLRGHIVPEIALLLKSLHFNRAFILPANPSKSRKIIGGKYLINETPLHETDFARDPYFPMKTSKVSEIVGEDSAKIPYQHISAGDEIPLHGIITGDAETMKDVEFYVKQVTAEDLLCGAADAFAIFLNRYFQPGQVPDIHLPVKEFNLVLNGSSVKNEEEKKKMMTHGFTAISCPAYQPSGQNLRLKHWYSEVQSLLHKKKNVVVEIPLPVLQSRTASEYFLRIFAELAAYLSKGIIHQQMHLWLTGGETAAGVIDNLCTGQLKLMAQLSPGSVTFEAAELGDMLISVKPGSYLWPDLLYNQ